MEKGASESQKYFKATLNFESDESDIIFFYFQVSKGYKNKVGHNEKKNNFLFIENYNLVRLSDEPLEWLAGI